MAQALGLASLARSRTVAPVLPGVDATRSGTAIDFRVRIALGGFDPHDSVAAQGVALLPLHAGVVDNGAHRARVLSEVFDVAVRILDAPPDEAELDRACLLLAHCEQVYRVGAKALLGSLGDALDRAENGLAFALGIDEPSLTDLRALMSANAGQLGSWRDLIAAGERFEPNPSFSGSALVGDADADWIVGDTLIESKAYSKLAVSDLRGFIRQLLGYVMLDLDDALSIRSVGLWLPRQGLTRTWGLDRLLAGNPEQLLPKLRAGFRTAAGSAQLSVREEVTQRRKHQILSDNGHTPSRMLVDLASSDDVDIRFRVGRNAATPDKTVRELARDRYAKVREGVARNERVPADVLDDLSRDDSVGVRRAAASNPRSQKEPGKAIDTGREVRRPLAPVTPTPTAPSNAATAEIQMRTARTRDVEALDTQWFARFLVVARGGKDWNGGRNIPLPKASERWATVEDRRIDMPAWLTAGLPETVTHDLMQEHRPTWVRRAVADELAVSDPAVRDALLADPDPEIRWAALRRTVEWPDDALAELLGRLAADRKERTRFRTAGDGRSAWERGRTPAEYDRETLALVASHPSSPPEALAQMLGSKTPDILVALVQNPALPVSDFSDLLPRVKTIRSHELRARLAASPRLPAEAAIALADDRDLDVRFALAQNGATPIETLQALAEDPEPSVRLAVVQNSRAPVELVTAVVESLLGSASDEVLLAALRVVDRRDDLEPTAELLADALDRLSRSRQREPDLRWIAAGDERAGARTLARLARSADHSVRSAVARNASAAADLLVTLAADSVSYVRASAAANESLAPDLLAALACDEDPVVRASAAGNLRLDPARLAELLHDDERRVRSSAYRNPSTRPGDKAEAEAIWERAWREAAPRRKDLEDRVASNRAEVRMEVAFDPRTPPDILVLLGGERRSAQVRRAVAANPNTPAAALASLADDKDSEVRQAVAFNSATPPEVLAGLADRSVDLALLVALNHAAPVGVLESLAEDSDPLISHIATGAHAERTALTGGHASADVRTIRA